MEALEAVGRLATWHPGLLLARLDLSTSDASRTGKYFLTCAEVASLGENVPVIAKLSKY